MANLVLNLTATAQWHALISEAQQASALQLNENCESYLVFLLMKYMEHGHLAESVIALEFLKTQELPSPRHRREALQEVGDKCLLFAGLFPERARKKLVRNNYFIHIGKGAYHALSESHTQGMAKLFTDLSKEFMRLIDVLRATRALSGCQGTLDPITAHEHWSETGNLQALQQLRKFTLSDSLITPSFDNKKEDFH